MLKKSLFFVIVALLLSNCTIHKRQVNKGYFVQWHRIEKSLHPEPDKKQESLTHDKTNIYYNDQNLHLNETELILPAAQEINRVETQLDKPQVIKMTLKTNEKIVTKPRKPNLQTVKVKVRYKKDKTLKPKLDKSKRKKSLIFLLLSLSSFALFLFILLSPLYSFSIPVFLFLSILIISYAGIIIFPILAIIYFILALRNSRTAPTN